METLLTPQEAYRAMFCFLEDYYERTGSDEIGGILGSLAVAMDGKTADEAMWQDWLQALQRALVDPFADQQVFLDD